MIGAEVIITIDGKEYALFKKSPLREYPHMVDVSTGQIPDGDQFPLLEKFLVKNGISRSDLGANTHTRVRQAIVIAQK